MYKITNITDKQGVIKQDFIDKLREKHGYDLLGEIMQYSFMKFFIKDKPPCCIFQWYKGGCMITSRVEKIDETDDEVCIVTENSIYTFKKVEE